MRVGRWTLPLLAVTLTSCVDPAATLLEEGEPASPQWTPMHPGPLSLGGPPLGPPLEGPQPDLRDVSGPRFAPWSSAPFPVGADEGPVEPLGPARVIEEELANNLVFENLVTGERLLWLFFASTFSSSAKLLTATTEWSIAGADDLNFDNLPDLVWENLTTGSRYVWHMEGATVLSATSLASVPTDWSIAGLGDFNGDGSPDLVWQNLVTGKRYLWYLNGTTVTGSAPLPTVSPDWSIAGVGDFTGDGQPDLVWEKPGDGSRYLWYMNGNLPTGGDPLPSVGTEWSIRGVGDFNRDGKPDLVWENGITGERFAWHMDGATPIGGTGLGQLGTEWSIAAVIKGNAPRILLPGESCSDYGNPFANLSFEDPNLEVAIRVSLGIAVPQLLTCELGAEGTVENIDAAASGVTSILGIQNFTGTRNLNLQLNSFTNLGPLSGLTGLISLDLGAILWLDGVTDLGDLSALTSLTFLGLRNNAITDIGALAALTGLERLDLGANAVTGVGALSGLTGLSWLTLHDNAITDIGALVGLTALTTLTLHGNPGLSDIQPLLDNPGLGPGDLVTLGGTSVSCVDVTALAAKGVIVASDCP